MSTTYLKFLLEVMAQTVAAPDTQAYLREGADGDDTLVGNAGNDTLFGGADKDLMVGGAGNGSEEVAMKLIAGLLSRCLYMDGHYQCLSSQLPT